MCFSQDSAIFQPAFGESTSRTPASPTPVGCAALFPLYQDSGLSMLPRHSTFSIKLCSVKIHTLVKGMAPESWATYTINPAHRRFSIWPRARCSMRCRSRPCPARSYNRAQYPAHRRFSVCPRARHWMRCGSRPCPARS